MTDPTSNESDNHKPDSAGTDADQASKAPEKDYHDHKDASLKSMLAYGLSSVIDDFADAAYDNMTKLLSIGFGISPLVAGFMSAIRTIWDGIADPIMAYISDNTRSRWGRRRPYILVGCIMMAVVSSWAFLPNTGALEPNTPIVPEEEFFDNEYKTFGKMLLGYNVAPHDLTIDIQVPDAALMFPKEIEKYEQKLVKDLAKASRRVVAWRDLPNESADTV